MASFGVNPVSPEASKSWLLRKTCPSSTGSKSTSHNHCAEVLVVRSFNSFGYSRRCRKLIELAKLVPSAFSRVLLRSRRCFRVIGDILASPFHRNGRIRVARQRKSFDQGVD